MTQGIKVFGHRGTRGEGNPPENSLAAFKAAIDQGAHGIELDLFLTKDKKLVVFHDDDLERMTGVKGNVTDKTLAELQAMRLRDTKGNFTEEKIPSYVEVLDMIEQEQEKHGLSKQNKERLDNFVVNTEIKGLGIASHVADEMAARLKKGWSKDNFQVSSFDMASLREMKRFLPEIPRGILYDDKELAQQINKTRDIAPDSINLTLPSLMANNGEAVKMIKAEGMRPVAWTYNEQNPVLYGAMAPEAKVEAAFLAEHGIDIITGFTAQRLAALKAVEKGTYNKV